MEEVGWFSENSNNETKPVGLKLPNQLGVFDMSGNVLEWCHDWFDGKYYKTCTEKGTVLNPKGPEVGSFRVLRGGSWSTDSDICHTMTRTGNTTDNRINNSGF